MSKSKKAKLEAIPAQVEKVKDVPIHDDFDARNDHDTILRAHAIKSDKKRMKKVHKYNKHQKKAFDSLDDVKEFGQKKYSGKNADKQNYPDDDMED